MSMSLIRASMSQQPRRTSSKRAGSKRWSSRGRPATHMKPTWKYGVPSICQTWWPSSVSITRGPLSAKRLGRRPSKVCGGSIRWSSTEMKVYFTGRGSDRAGAAG
jgi:hypothetical protein